MPPLSPPCIIPILHFLYPIRLKDSHVRPMNGPAFLQPQDLCICSPVCLGLSLPLSLPHSSHSFFSFQTNENLFLLT